ncbi:MAG: hypothetical protein K2K66_02340 [Ruminococcus sp.]|nr:hypothetical protein [Ruminococcus sp.]
MLFVQYIGLTYYKNVRYANYANVRNSIKFAPINIEKVPECEVLLQRVPMFQDTDGISKYKASFKKYGQEIFTVDNLDPCRNYYDIISNIRIFKVDDGYKIRFCDDRSFSRHNAFKRRGHNESFMDNNSPFCYTDIINETAFTLKPNEYGRIIYNERNVTIDEQWYYKLYVVNFINCDKSKYREKMFFRKVPDYEYKNMQYLRYC